METLIRLWSRLLLWLSASRRLRLQVESLSRQIADLNAAYAKAHDCAVELQDRLNDSMKRESEARTETALSVKALADWLAMRVTGRPIYGVVPPVRFDINTPVEPHSGRLNAREAARRSAEKFLKSLEPHAEQ